MLPTSPLLRRLRTRAARTLAAAVVPLLLLGNAWAEVIHIDNAELEKLLAKKTPLVDIRTEAEWRETGVIQGSKLLTFFDEKGNANPPQWLQQLKPIATAETPVILICRSGNRTQAVSKFLSEQAGYRTVYNVKQGLKGWVKENRPVTSMLAAGK